MNLLISGCLKIDFGILLGTWRCAATPTLSVRGAERRVLRSLDWADA